MRYLEFKDVMIAKGYSIVDVMDCIRDFLRSDACPSVTLLALNEHVALYCDNVYDRFKREKMHYDLDDAFDKLIVKYFEHNWFQDRSIDDVLDDLCYDIWENFCYLDSRQFDSYWQDLLKDC